MNNLGNNVDDIVECPLCMEPLEVDDLNFFPCTCGYQICRFCWHRIRTDENELCPACRKAYPENPADFKPLTHEEMIALKSQKRQRDQQRKQKITENRKHLTNVRVVQKNLVFVVGLPPRLADADILKKHEYFGKYGKIHKVVINPSTTYAGVQGPSASAYVTYVHNTDALRAIQSVNNIMIDGRLIKTSLGTTKYCSHFMKNQQCPKGDCMYLHELGDPEASFTKEEMHQGKHQEYERRLHDILIASSGTKAGVTPCSVSSTGASVAFVSTSNNSSISVSSDQQKEAWPSLSPSPFNQKDLTSNTHKNRKDRSKQEKNKNEKNIKAKSNKTNINNVRLMSFPKDVDLSIRISNSTADGLTTTNNLKIDKKDRNQASLSTRAISKNEMETSEIKEDEVKDLDNHPQSSTTVSLKLDNIDESCNNIRNDTAALNKINSSGSCRVISGNNSAIEETTSGRSSPSSFSESNLIDEFKKSPLKCKQLLTPNSELDAITDSDIEIGNLMMPNPFGYVENLFKENENISFKIPRQSIIDKLDNHLYENEKKNYQEDNYNDILPRDDENADDITDTVSKLNLFDEKCILKLTSGISQQSMPTKVKENEETISNQSSSGTTSNLPDLINGIDGNQNSTTDWESALKNVMIRTNKHVERKLQQNLQQQIQNQNHVKNHQDFHRPQEVQKHNNNILASLSLPQHSTSQNGSELIRQASFLQHNQHQWLKHQSSQTLSENALQSQLFGTNMSRFFDFHKHQQQKLQQHLKETTSNASLNENARVMPIVDSCCLNSQYLDQSSILPSQLNKNTNQKQLAKIDHVFCHQQLHPQNQQRGSIQSQKSQFIHTASDDDLGFDPFIETQKALAELIENEDEQQSKVSPASILTQHNQSNSIHQTHQSHIMDIMMRPHMPPPGFNQVNLFGGYDVAPRLQNNSKIMPFTNISNNYAGQIGQHTQHQQQLQIPSNAWNAQLGNFQHHITEQQICPVNLNQTTNASNQKSYTSNDWTAMDPAILSFRQFSFPQQTQIRSQLPSHQQEMFLQQLSHHQQQSGFNSQSQLGGNSVAHNTIINSQQSLQPHVNSNVQGMLEYLKTRQFV